MSTIYGTSTFVKQADGSYAPDLSAYPPGYTGMTATPAPDGVHCAVTVTYLDNATPPAPAGATTDAKQAALNAHKLGILGYDTAGYVAGITSVPVAVSVGPGTKGAPTV